MRTDNIEYLLDIPCYLGGEVQTFRFTSGDGCEYGGYTYEGRISNAGSIKYMMFADGTTMGKSQIGWGDIVIDNADGAYDHLINGGFSGRVCMIRELIAGVTIGLTLSCSVEQPEFTTSDINIRVKDPQILLNIPVQPNKYGGTNSLPAGIDGTSDIQGKPKPLLYGQCSNVTPVCVNTSRLIYQAHDGALYSISNVYDKGVALTFGVDRANNAAMQSNPPAAGTYDTCLAEGLIRLGSSPFGVVTLDAIQGATTADRTAAQIAKTVALKAITSGDMIAGDFTALDTLNSSVIGIYITEETLIPAVLDEVLNSIGGWYGFDSAGKFNVGRLDAPSGTAAVSLTNYEIQELTRLATQDEGRGLPTWKVNLGYSKNFTVQDAASLAGKVLSVTPKWVAGSSTPGSSIVSANGVFVGGGGSTNVRVSTDGFDTYQVIDLPINCIHLAVANDVFFAFQNGTSTSAAVSLNGIDWTTVTIPSGTYMSGSVAYGNGVYVLTSFTSTVAASSVDAISWTARTIPANSGGKVTFGNNTFVSSGASGNGATSSDGATWNAETLPAYQVWALTYGNGFFVGTGNDGTNGIAIRSLDGKTWYSVILEGSISMYYLSFGNGVFVTSALGTSLGYTSIDGLVWGRFDPPSNIVSPTYGDNKFLASTNGNGLYNWAFSPTQYRLNFTLKNYRTLSTADLSIQTTYLNGAQELNINTLLVSATDAQTEATRQLNLRKVRRDYIAVKIKRSALAALPDLGNIINITYPRFGYDTGKKFVLIGFEMFLETDDLTLYLWG